MTLESKKALVAEIDKIAEAMLRIEELAERIPNLCDLVNSKNAVAAYPFLHCVEEAVLDCMNWSEAIESYAFYDYESKECYTREELKEEYEKTADKNKYYCFSAWLEERAKTLDKID